MIKTRKRKDRSILPGVEAMLGLHLCANIFEGLVAVQFHNSVLVVLPLRWCDFACC